MAETPQPAFITFDDFQKVQLRVGKVVEAADHPNADKLLVLKVDLGNEQRQICAGIKGCYAPEQLVGQSIIVVANLAPRTMRGIESQGMLLAAGADDRTRFVLLTTADEVPPGSRVT